MSGQAPSVGRIVHYRLSEGDASVIAHQRLTVGSPQSNAAQAGDVYPAIVVRVFDPSVTTANLQVFLDGTDSYWATSRQEGDDPGTWFWPPRV